MSKIDDLIKSYAQFVAFPWPPASPVNQRTWFAVYDPADERRLRQHMGEFENATRQSGHGWQLLDLTGAFAEWIGQHDYRDAYFESPEDLQMELGEFEATVTRRIAALLGNPAADERAVCALLGASSLFGLARLSDVLDPVVNRVRGRLLLFFPGQHDGVRYRFLDAHSNWNYHAIPIKATPN